MAKSRSTTEKRSRRHARIRTEIAGTSARPRLSVFKSNKYLYVQIIDDNAGKTLASMNSKTLSGKSELEKALTLGKEIAKKAVEKNIKKVVFDRGGYIYTGKVEALARGAREGGLSF
jgi:large subunit ribosomal protein L18